MKAIVYSFQQLVTSRLQTLHFSLNQIISFLGRSPAKCGEVAQTFVCENPNANLLVIFIVYNILQCQYSDIIKSHFVFMIDISIFY